MLRSLVETVKAVNPRFEIIPCPTAYWTLKRQFMVVKYVPVCNDMGGFYRITHEPYPVLYLPADDYVDRNIVMALKTRTMEAARAYSKKLNEERYSGTHKVAGRFAEERADELHFYANQAMKGFRPGWRKGVNAMDQIRKFQDDHGRDMR